MHAAPARVIDASYEVVSEQTIDPRAVKERLKEAVRSLVGELEAEVDRRIQRKTTLEQRWLHDLRQYHGLYEDDVLQSLQREKKSQLFINITRPKTNSAAARLFDMLFPTDDRNWGINPTPVPELADQMQEGDRLAREVEARANQLSAAGPEGDAQAHALVAQAEPIVSAAFQARMEMEEAQKRAAAMEREIDDQFKECDYNAQCRDAIDDATQIGTGILKGPVNSTKMAQKWTTVRDPETGATIQVLESGQSKKPAVYWTNPWHFFPDPDARTIDESDGIYERHLMTAKQLRNLSRLRGFDAEEINELLKETPRQSVPSYLADLHAITEARVRGNTGTDTLYHVFEYYGSLTTQRLQTIADALGMADMADYYDGEDNLSEWPVCIWFCQGRIIKFAEHPLDSGAPLYSLFTYQRDAASLWGYGVPYMMRDSQAAINAAYRMMMDNAGLSTGPQIFMHQESIEPADGDWTLKPRKVWKLKRRLQQGERVVDSITIDSRQTELMAIVNLVRQMIDDETGISKLAEGDQSSNVQQTAQGMAMLMNSTNVVFKRVIRNWDDDVTKPTLRRVYEWNMQFSEKEEIKGDFEVDARGSAVLMVRELEAANLMGLVDRASVNPRLGPITKIVPAYRKAVQAMHLAADDVVMTDDEIEQMEAEQANQPPPPNPEMLKLELEREKIASAERIAIHKADSDERVAVLRHETAMMQVAEKMNMTEQQLRTMLTDKREERASKERIVAGEMAIAERTGKHAGGYV